MLFADLHLTDGAAGTGNAQHFGTIGGLLEGTLMPTGPYAIILWTRYPDQANALRDHLEKRLVGVSKPFAVVPLDKADHLNPDGTLRSAQALRDAIHGLLGAQPQLAALFNWEERVLGASAATVSAVIDLATAGVAPRRQGCRDRPPFVFLWTGSRRRRQCRGGSLPRRQRGATADSR